MNEHFYSEREWNFLTHYGEYDWPEDWKTVRENREGWEPVVERIAHTHELAMTTSPEIGAGTNLAFVLDETIIKIFGRYNPIRFPRELEALRLLENYPEIRTPLLLADGTVEYAAQTYHYIVMERLPGQLFRWKWDGMTPDDRIDVIRQVAPIVRALHSVPLHGLKSFGTDPSEWNARMMRRAELAPSFYAQDWPDYLLQQLPVFLEEYLPILQEPCEPRLLHGDVIGGNIMVEQMAGRWEVTALIDFGDVETGPLEYEWISLCQKACRSDRTMIEPFFTEYGFPYPFSGDTLRRIRLYSILHGFPMMRWAHEDHPDCDQLTELIDRMNGM